MSKQPEAKLKQALAEGFDAVFGKQAPNAFWNYVKGTKWGLPDQFFTALGGSVWVESKIGSNGLEKTQELVVPRMVGGGTLVWLLQGDTHLGHKKDRVVTLTKVFTTEPPWVIRGWDTFKQLPFWQKLLGAA